MLSGNPAVAELPPDDVLFGGVSTSAVENYAGQALTPADALLPRVLPPAVVAGMFQSGGLYVVYSSPGELKTMLLMDMGYCVALGRPWLPGVGKDKHPGFPVTQSPVLWVDQDNGSGVMAERMAAMARAYGVGDAPFYCLSFPVPTVAAARGLTALTHYAKEVGAGMVVFDNLLRIAGVRDENAAEVDVAMGNLRRFAEDTGAAVVVIHHRRKDTSGREGDSLRGHGSIEGSLDGAFLVTRAEDSDIAQVKNTKWRRRNVPTFAAEFSFESAEDGDTLHAARFWRAEVSDKRHELTNRMRSQVLAALDSGPKNSTQLTALVTGRASAVKEVIGQMHIERAIVCELGTNNAKVYRLP
jgi:hypothetical protein